MKKSFSQLLRFLWRLCPRHWRDDIFHAFCNYIAPKAKKTDDIASNAYIVAGFFSAQTGLARSAELLAQAFEHAGKKVCRLDISGYFVDGQKITSHGDLPENIPMVVHVNPPLLGYLFLRLGRKFIKQRPVISYWAWELAQVPPLWKSSFALVTRVWAASIFCQKAFEEYTPFVACLPHPVEPIHISPSGHPSVGGNDKIVRNFDFPKDTFKVLFVFSMGSGVERKNPHAVLDAFNQAFGDQKDVLCIIKITHAAANLHETERLQRRARHNIHILCDDMPYVRVMELISLCDVYCSLHRSEGFGLTLAEAMSLGKAVMATRWSGNLDFMDENCAALVDYTFVPAHYHAWKTQTQQWADPDINHAASLLRRLYENSSWRYEIGKRAREKIKNTLSIHRISEKLLRILSYT